MKSTVSLRCIPGATTNAMKHHPKGCLEDFSPDNIILHHGTNNLESHDNSEKSDIDITSDIVDLGLPVKNEKTMVYISRLVIRNNKLDKKRKEINDFIKQQCFTNHLCFIKNILRAWPSNILGFINNENTNLGMLNKNGLHLNENGTKRLVNNFCFSMAK